MRKRSRLRSERGGKGRVWMLLVPICIALSFSGYFLYGQAKNGALSFLLDKNAPQNDLLDSRGAIFDRNYKELAVTLDRVSVFADVRDVEPDEAAAELSVVLGVNPESIREAISREHYRAWLAKNINQEEEEQIAHLALKGVHLHKERARYYPEKETAAHVVGFVGKSMGLSGVEYRYNTLLSKYGARLADSARRLTPSDTSKQTEESQGQYLVLTIDLKIQRLLEKLVKNLCKDRENTKVAALLMESATGKIIGAAAYPSFDPNRFRDYSWEQLESILDEPIQVPMKIQKLLWDASLLQSRYEDGDDIIPWSVHSAHRSFGSQLRLWDRLGLNDTLSIDFIKDEVKMVGSTATLLKSLKPNLYDSVGESATPMHLVYAINGLVMGGAHPLPHVVDKIMGKDGKYISLKPKNSEAAVDDVVAGEIRKLLKSQMTKGPISSGYIETEVLSYTETNKGRSFSKNTAYFSIIPQDKPKLMLFVFASLPPFSPSPSKTKSRFVVAEYAKKITLPMVALQEVMSNLSDMMSVEEKNEMNFGLQKEVEQGVVTGGLIQAEVYGTMPDLKGLSLRKSLRLLKDLKLEIQINGTGVVVEQTPNAGSRVKQGELCRLVLKPH